MNQYLPGKWVRDIVEECMEGRPLKVGDVIKHPDGRTVKITDGQFWGTFGLSNFWYWQEVKEDGSLGEKEHGYGWIVKDPEDLDAFVRPEVE